MINLQNTQKQTQTQQLNPHLQRIKPQKMSGPSGSRTNEDQANQSPPPPQATTVTSGRADGDELVPVSAVVASNVPTVIPGATTGSITIVVPPRQFNTDNQAQDGGAAAASAGAGASGSGVGGDSERGRVAHRQKGQLVEVPNGPPVCYVCNRGFGSWKAVFGHLRIHKVGDQRARPGGFPPPVFTPPASPERETGEAMLLQEQLAPTLLTIAKELVVPNTDFAPSTSIAAAASLTPPLARFGIDLNDPPQPPPESPVEVQGQQPASPSASESSGSIDLNVDLPGN